MSIGTAANFTLFSLHFSLCCFAEIYYSINVKILGCLFCFLFCLLIPYYLAVYQEYLTAVLATSRVPLTAVGCLSCVLVPIEKLPTGQSSELRKVLVLLLLECPFHLSEWLNCKVTNEELQSEQIINIFLLTFFWFPLPIVTLTLLPTFPLCLLKSPHWPFWPFATLRLNSGLTNATPDLLVELLDAFV